MIKELSNCHLLNKKATSNLKCQEAKTPGFKIAPNIHEEGNLVRPTISSVNCHTNNNS